MSVANDDSPTGLLGEKLGVFLMGIGLGYLVAIEATVSGGDEISYVGLSTITLGVLVSAYFRRDEN
ncbi:hypothetical protein [Halorussus lipolyticus]|uniref:hypothetical protein n=1 Tax=Halorussus lipolyticus TaxID=3034024 RepID=UPI0023E8224E|nr:hypothetical protein [Halorussus sp. DT80]